MKEPGPRDRRPLFGTSSHSQATASTSGVDPESLERENDQNIDNLGQRTSLLRQAGDMGSARMGLGATVHRFRKVSFVQLVSSTTSCTTHLFSHLQQLSGKDTDVAEC
ncbi:TPA: hypothetical protein ACH3X1_004529 [Trebouxia sp. C0004]